MKCQVCGYENPPDSTICLNCGSTIEHQPVGEAIDDISDEQTVLIGGGLKPPAPEPPPPPPPPSPPPVAPPSGGQQQQGEAPRTSPPPPPPPPAGRPGADAQPPAGFSAGGPGGQLPPSGNPPGTAGSPPSNTLAIVSLILGILTITLGWCCGLFIPLGIGGIVTGIIARKQIAAAGGSKQSDTLAKVGLILSIVFVAIWTIVSIIGFVYNMSSSNF